MKTYRDAEMARDSLASYIQETGEASRAASWVATRLAAAITQRQRIAAELKAGKLTWPPSRPHLVEDKKLGALKGAYTELHNSLNARPVDVQELAQDLALGMFTLAWDVTSDVTGFWPDDAYLHAAARPSAWNGFENDLNSSFNALASEMIEWINEMRLPELELKSLKA